MLARLASIPAWSVGVSLLFRAMKGGTIWSYLLPDSVILLALHFVNLDTRPQNAREAVGDIVVVGVLTVALYATYAFLRLPPGTWFQ